MLSELPYQSPQLLILPMPEREGSARTHAESSGSRWRKGQKDHRLRAGSHEGSTYYMPRTTDTATGRDRAAPSCGNHGPEGANQRLPQTRVKPADRNMVTASSGRPRDRLTGRLVRLECRKQVKGGCKVTWEATAGAGPHTSLLGPLHHTKPLRHLSSGWSRSNVHIMHFTLAASRKGAVRGQNGGREAMRDPQAREDSDGRGPAACKQQVLQQSPENKLQTPATT